MDGDPISSQTRALFGWMSIGCFFLLILTKAIRFSDPDEESLLIGIAPSVFGPPGLLFLMLSNSGRLGKLSLFQLTLFVGAIALGLEFAQLLSRPGILAYVAYTFDWLDVLASVLSLLVAYIVTRFILRLRGS
ncbi:MAG: hypothetical protein AAB209_04180 [Bacteroidota bacterium]